MTQDYRFGSGLAMLSQVLLTLRTCYVIFIYHMNWECGFSPETQQQDFTFQMTS